MFIVILFYLTNNLFTGQTTDLNINIHHTIKLVNNNIRMIFVIHYNKINHPKATFYKEFWSQPNEKQFYLNIPSIEGFFIKTIDIFTVRCAANLEVIATFEYSLEGFKKLLSTNNNSLGFSTYCNDKNILKTILITITTEN